MPSLTDDSQVAEAPADTLYNMFAVPRETPWRPEFPFNPGCRPAGSLPALVLNLASDPPSGLDIAMGRLRRKRKADAAELVQAIRAAKDRSIQLVIDDAGGDADATLVIIYALLLHEWAVSCRIVGKCFSGAAFIALAADRRTIVAAGSVLLHRARHLLTTEQWENVKRLPAHETQAINDRLNDFDDIFSALLQVRLGVAEQTALRWMREEKIWSSVESLENRFSHAIEKTDDGIASLIEEQVEV